MILEHRQATFFRTQRFGKSLLVSMIAAFSGKRKNGYYDDNTVIHMKPVLNLVAIHINRFPKGETLV
jgi:hypothetical protein